MSLTAIWRGVLSMVEMADLFTSQMKFSYEISDLRDIYIIQLLPFTFECLNLELLIKLLCKKERKYKQILDNQCGCVFVCVYVFCMLYAFGCG